MATQTELAKQLNDSELTLDEKLAAIDLALSKARAEDKSSGVYAAGVDPSEALMCEGCQ